MPTYDYKCDNCGHALEMFQSIKARPLRKCPGCGKNSLKRLIGTGAGLIFKGSGFYATDYRSPSYQTSAKKETDSGKPADAAKAADSRPVADAKTAKKSEKKT